MKFTLFQVIADKDGLMIDIVAFASSFRERSLFFFDYDSEYDMQLHLFFIKIC